MRVNEQKELLVDLLEFAPKSPSRWDMDRKQFFGKLDATIAALPKPMTVSLQVHDDLQAKYDDVLKRMRRRRSGHMVLVPRAMCAEAIDAGHHSSVSRSSSAA